MLSLTINGRKFSAEEVAKKLGITDSVVTMSLRVPIPAGNVEAYAFNDEFVVFPGIDTMINTTDKEGRNISFTVTRTEQALKDEDPTTYLYGRTEPCIAYLKNDIRPEDEFDADPKNPKLVVGGDTDYRVQLYAENEFVDWRGQVSE